MLKLLILSAVLVVSACTNTQSPLDGPFGVPWDADSARAFRIMEKHGFRRDSALETLMGNGTGNRMYWFRGGDYHGIGGSSSDDSLAGGVQYSLSFSDGELNVAFADFYFADWPSCRSALDRLSTVHNRIWGAHWTTWLPDPVARYVVPPDPKRSWPSRDRVSADIFYDSVSGPPFKLKVCYGRESDDPVSDTIATIDMIDETHADSTGKR
jgi:hypothetical protein